jgi:hypothetical protein
MSKSESNEMPQFVADWDINGEVKQGKTLEASRPNQLPRNSLQNKPNKNFSIS